MENLDAMHSIVENFAERIEFQEAQIRGLRRDLKNVSPSLYTEKARYNEHFARINADAVNKHGFSYITASEAAIRVVERFGLNIERPEIKALTASIVSAILDISKSST